MRNYTYIEGSRFKINNIYRSKRFDIDRLDINLVEQHRADFVRGFRIVDHDLDETTLVHGEDADDLLFSLSFILCHNENDDALQYDNYLISAVSSQNYLIDVFNENFAEASKLALH